MSDLLTITPDDTRAPDDDRFHRFGLIGWWDQKKLAAAKVLVIGAGALGNEIVKNLALLGVGQVLIADLDRIENSNLSRSVLYRVTDAGQYKATVAARAARDIYPDMRTQAFVGDVVNDLGLGVFRWADVVIGGLDNREARLSINRNCWRVNRPWIDGAIEQIDGVARVFVPDGPCYECTMTQRDWDMIRHRRSCNLLSRSEMQTGKTPTTPTVSSIIAGVQTQEAVKLLHGLPVIGGRGWVFNGLGTDAYQTEYQRKPDCYSHDIADEIVSLDASSDTMTGWQLLAEAESRLGEKVSIELAREVLHQLICPSCGMGQTVFAAPGSVKAGSENCPDCGSARRVVTFGRLNGDEDFLDLPLANIGVPKFDILFARAGGRLIGFELGGDAGAVLGPLVETGLELL